MGNRGLIKLRLATAEYLKNVKRSGNDDIFAEFKLKNEKLLADASNELHRLAFIKLLNDVSRHTISVSNNFNQLEIFTNLRHPKIISVPIYINGKIVKREKVDFYKASIADIQAWRNLEKNRRNKRPSPKNEIDKILSLILGKIKDTSILMEDALTIIQK